MPLQVCSLVYSLLSAPFLATGIAAAHLKSPVKLNEEGSYIFFFNVPSKRKQIGDLLLLPPTKFLAHLYHHDPSDGKLPPILPALVVQ